MGAPEVSSFLSHLAVRQNVAASTQNQAFSAVLFLYREVLGRRLDALERTLLGRLHGAPWLMASLTVSYTHLTLPTILRV